MSIITARTGGPPLLSQEDTPRFRTAENFT